MPSYVAAYLGIAYGEPMMVLRTVVAALAWIVRGWCGYPDAALGVSTGWAVFATAFMKVWVDLLARNSEWLVLVRNSEWLVGDGLTAPAGNPGHDPRSYPRSGYLMVEIGLGTAAILLVVRSVLGARRRTAKLARAISG